MAKLKKIHFYYGAILDALCQYNPDASPVLMSQSHEESRQTYKVMTNTSMECILFFKYASPKINGRNKDDVSYLFTFSDDDKQKLKDYQEKYNYPIFIYLLCKQSELKDSEIIILKYEEYQNVEEKRAITIRIQKNKNFILLFRRGSKSEENAYRIPRNRIEKTFDELIVDNMKVLSNGVIRKSNNLSEMDLLIDSGIKVYGDSMICPICDNQLNILTIHNNRDNMKSRICPICKRRYVNKQQYKIIRKYCGDNRLIPDLFIMDFPNEDFQKNIKETVVEKLTSQASSDLRDVAKNYLYIIPKDSEVCPIHKCKMDIKTLTFGIKLKDTVHFCRSCNKHIISQEQCDFLKNQNIKNRNRIIQSITFKNLIESDILDNKFVRS